MSIVGFAQQALLEGTQGLHSKARKNDHGVCRARLVEFSNGSPREGSSNWAWALHSMGRQNELWVCTAGFVKMSMRMMGGQIRQCLFSMACQNVC